MYGSCPCCGEMDNWHFQSGVINGELIEPAEWTCERCGFEYMEHVKYQMREAALKFAPVAVENVRRETIKECAEIARKQAWSHACEGFENGPELNSDAIYKDIRALADKAAACSVCGNKWPREQYEELRPVDASDGWCPSCGEGGDVEEEG